MRTRRTLRIAALPLVLTVILAGCATCSLSLRVVDSPEILGGPRVQLVYGLRADGLVAQYGCTLPLDIVETQY